MLDIITNADNEIYEDNLLMITDAYQVSGWLVLNRTYTQGKQNRLETYLAAFQLTFDFSA